MFDRLANEERGAALIVALGVTFVVLLLSTVVVSQAIHSADQSGYDRRRLTSVNSAEAGLNYFYHCLETTPPQNLLTGCSATGAVGSGPNGSNYTVSATYYSDKNGTTPIVGSMSSNNIPLSVRLRSVGTSNGEVERTMESFVQLTPVYSGLSGALIANSSTSFTNNFTVNGNNGNDADVYVLSGDFNAQSGLETIKGSVYVPSATATATIGTSLHLYGDVWANGSVTINHPQAQVDGSVKSTASSVTVSSGHVSGAASYCAGTAPQNVSGTKTQTCSLGPPPSQSFPQITYSSGAWDSLGYKEYVFGSASACTDARTWLEGTGATQWNGGAIVPAGYTGAVIRITTQCPFDVSNNATITVGKNLGIATVGSISLSNQSRWYGVSGSVKSLFFLSPWPSSGLPSCPAQNVSIQNNTNFDSYVQTGVYSACTATMNNNNTAFSGQVIGTSLAIGNNFNMTFKPVVIPGASVAKFREDIAYIREVTS
jgi:hypothetical protein